MHPSCNKSHATIPAVSIQASARSVGEERMIDRSPGLSRRRQCQEAWRIPGTAWGRGKLSDVTAAEGGWRSMARAQWPDVTTAARRVRWGRGGSKTGGCACAVGVGMESVTRARDARCLTSRERAMSLELQRWQLPVGGALCWARGRAPLDVSVGGGGEAGARAAVRGAHGRVAVVVAAPARPSLPSLSNHGGARLQVVTGGAHLALVLNKAKGKKE